MGAFRKKKKRGFAPSKRISPSELGSVFFFSFFRILPIPSARFFSQSSWVTKHHRLKRPNTSCPTHSSPTSRMPSKESIRRAPGKFQPPSWGCYEDVGASAQTRPAAGVHRRGGR